MRPLPPIVACTMLLLGLTATGSLADPSLVADLDSNATNGPDTLQADIGDTILVRVWIADSADSLLGFGVTLGDTSGTLAWAEDDTDAVYTTPGGWANIPVHVDENGRLLLQAHDFSFSEPLHIPRQVAVLKFLAAQPESCAALTWDPEVSGWQNWDLDVGSFASFEGAVVCVAGEEDGGGDEGEGDGDEGGGLDSSPAECESLPCCTYVEDKPETGRVWVVNDNGTIGTDCDCNDIQACIDTAAAGDTICVNPGDYDALIARPYERLDPFIDPYFSICSTTFSLDQDSLVVRGIAGPAHTVVGKLDTLIRHVCVLVCDIASGQDGLRLDSCLIEGFTFRDAYTQDIVAEQAFGAGAMFCSGVVKPSVVIRGNVFVDNRGRHGGAIRTQGSPRIKGNEFRNNKCAQLGTGTGPRAGGILVGGTGHPTIEGNTFLHNGCEPGASLRFPGGALAFEATGGLVRRNIFRENWGTKGGAIFLYGADADPTVEYNVFDRCSVDVFGGAIASEDANARQHPVVRHNTFIHNAAPDENGGTLYAGSNPSFTLDFHHNIVACSKGGGVVCDPGSSLAALTCCDFWMNEGPDTAGIPSGKSVGDLLFEDPILCFPNPCSLYAIHEESPCAPADSGDCGLIGALGVCYECGDTVASCDSMIPTGVSALGAEIHGGKEDIVVGAPNPFNAHLGITFNIPSVFDRAAFTVFDVRGRIVCERCCDGHVGGGAWVWNGKDSRGRQLPSGIYFVRLKADGMSPRVEKVLLLR